MIPFLGRYLYTIDEKGRMNVPAKFRDILKLEPSFHLILTKGFDGCLYLLPVSTWEKFQARLEQEEFQSEKEARFFERSWVKDGDVQVPDAQGRIQISKELRDFAGIGKECLIYGANNRIELWQPALFEKAMSEMESESSKSLEDLAGSYFRRRT